MRCQQVFNTIIKFDQFFHKLRILACCGQVNSDVDGCLIPGGRENDGKNTRGGCSAGEYMPVKILLPKRHGSSFSSFIKGKSGIMEVIRAKTRGIFSSKEGHLVVQITLI